MNWLDRLAAICSPPQQQESQDLVVPCPICGERTIDLPPGEPCTCCYMEGKAKPLPAPAPRLTQGDCSAPSWPCSCCGEAAWWWRAPNKAWGSPSEWVCGRCHPSPLREEVAP